MKKSVAFLISVMLMVSVFMGNVMTASAGAKLKTPGSVKAASASATSVKVSWSKVSGADGYVVYRANSKNGKYAKVGTAQGVSYTDKKLSGGKTYYYKVRAYEKVGKKTVYSGYSPMVSGKAALKKPGSVKAASASATSVKVSWSKVSGADGYVVYRANSKNGKYAKVGTAQGVSYTDKKLSGGKTYYYKVRAYEKVGKKTVYSGYSPMVSGKTKAPLAAPSTSGALQVRGTRLTDRRGNPVQLRGISTHGIAWYPEYINQSCFRQLRQEWNVNAIRLAMYTEEYGGYCAGGNQKRLKELIHKGVTYAKAQDMYVIIDWHILSDGNPNKHFKEAKAFFKEISKKYAGYNNVIYEICNEPNGGTSWKQIKSYAEQIIKVIRANDKDAVILVGTPNWSQYVDQAAKSPIKKYDNIMYTLHFYAATHKDGLRNSMVSAIKKGLPVFVSEYGICDASGNGAIDKTSAKKWVDAMDQYGVSYVAWNLSNKGETSAILKSGCRKTSGFGQQDLSDSGKWLYSMLTGKKTAAAPKNPPAKSDGGTKTPKSVSWKQDGNLSCTAKLVNSWESGGKTFFQYTLTVKNTSKAKRSNWSVNVPFNGSFALVNSWNGKYAVKGKTLRISAMDYNGAIPAGGSVSDIGFIVQGSAKLKIG